MVASEMTIPLRTAADLMIRDVRTIRDTTPLGEAARQLGRIGHRGAPVVDADGRCVGVLSVSDLSRWAADRSEGGTALPRTCSFQSRQRNVGGREVELCLLSDNVCPFQRITNYPDGKETTICTQPHCVPTDWQMVELDAAPWTVRDAMTTEVVSVEPDAALDEMARLMLERGIHRLLVLDSESRPVGIVAIDDLLRMLAYPGLVRNLA